WGAAECCSHPGGRWERRDGPGLVGSWRHAFLRAPSLRATLIALGVLSETFEPAITWARFEAFDDSVTTATTAAVRAACGEGTVTRRFTHAYPDGPAPYYTILAPLRRGEEEAQWT